MRILLVGMMGSGKTTIGSKLAARTGWPLLDNDQLVRELAGREPASIAAEDGEDRLREAETEALMRALDREPPLWRAPSSNDPRPGTGCVAPATSSGSGQA
jgi:shikimate kinase